MREEVGVASFSLGGVHGDLWEWFRTRTFAVVMENRICSLVHNGLGGGGRARERCELGIQMKTEWKNFSDNLIPYTRWKYVEIPFASLSTLCVCATTYLENL